MNISWIPAIVAVVLLLGTIGAGLVILFSRMKKQGDAEREKVLAYQKEHIGLLESRVEILEREVVELHTLLNEWREMRISEIGDHVAEKVEARLEEAVRNLQG